MTREGIAAKLRWLTNQLDIAITRANDESAAIALRDLLAWQSVASGAAEEVDKLDSTE